MPQEDTDTREQAQPQRRYCVTFESTSSVHVTVEAATEVEALALAREDIASGAWQHAVEDPPDVDLNAPTVEGRRS